MIPSGKHTKDYWKWPIEIVDLPINTMVVFHSYVNVYQRVHDTPIQWLPRGCGQQPRWASTRRRTTDLDARICKNITNMNRNSRKTTYLPPVFLTESWRFYLSIHPSIYPTIDLSIHLSLYISIYLYLYLSLSLSIYLYLSINISINLTQSISIDLKLYISIYIYLSLSINQYINQYISLYLNISQSISI